MLITVFTRSNYTLAERFANDVDSVTAARRQEEATFASLVGATWIDLDFPEASLRGYGSLAEIFQGSVLDTGLVEAVRRAIESCLLKLQPELLLFPMGLGNHIDHRIVRQAVLELSQLQRRMLAYEELPYASKLSLAEKEDFAEQIGCRRGFTPLQFSNITKKLEAVGKYSTQVGPNEIRAVVSNAQAAGGSYEERLWTWQGRQPTKLDRDV